MSNDTKAFQNRLADDVGNYIDHLWQSCGYSITLHQMEGIASGNWYRLLKYNYHGCALCRAVKASSAAWLHCVNRQHKVRQRAQESPYVGTCWAGVTECVFPLQDIHLQTCGFLCVSGYTIDRDISAERAVAVAEKYRLPKAKLLKAVECLNPDIPDLEALAVQIAPIQDMLTTLFHFSSLDDRPRNASSPREALYERIIDYTNHEYRSSALSLSVICKKFNISYAYASHLFTAYADVPFTRYVRRMRIEASKRYLEHTDLAISLIAPEIGFADSNYFSSVFREETGMTPTEYRLRCMPVDAPEPDKPSQEE